MHGTNVETSQNGFFFFIFIVYGTPHPAISLIKPIFPLLNKFLHIDDRTTNAYTFIT